MLNKLMKVLLGPALSNLCKYQFFSSSDAHHQPSQASTTTKRTTTTTTTRRPTTTKRPRPPLGGGGGGGKGKRCRRNGAYIADKKDCSKYYRCVNKKLVQNVCPPGLVFNDQRKSSALVICDWPKVVDCKNRPNPCKQIL